MGEDSSDCGVPCATSLTQMAEWEDPSTVAAILVEPVGGAVGGYMPPEEYMRHLRSFCDEHGILLIADEVLTGFGRTGRWFVIDHSGVSPDMLVMAKGLTAGYAPMGAVGGNERIASFSIPVHSLRVDLLRAPTFVCSRPCLSRGVDGGEVERSRETGKILEAQVHGLRRNSSKLGRPVRWVCTEFWNLCR